MKRILFCAVTGGLALAGCASTPPASETPPLTCNDQAGQAFIGQKATAELGPKLIEATGARQLRWVPPRTGVTMDLRPGRLTVSYDDDMVVTQVSCT